MTDSNEYDYGPLRLYEVTWRDRPAEIVQGHQVLFDSNALFREFAGEPKFRIHGMFPGRHWRMVLMAPESAAVSIRDVTDQVAELEALNDN